MKKNFIVSLSFLFLLVLLVTIGCKSNKEKSTTETHNHAKEQEYTCPMHPQIVQDKPGQCPICGMDLVPRQTSANDKMVDSTVASVSRSTNQNVVASAATIVPESGTRIFSHEVQGSISYDTRRQTSLASRVSGRIERLYIKYNYQQVRKGQLIMEIYSPELAAAQRELLYLNRVDKNSDLLQKARQRLLLLGMGDAQVRQVLTTGKVLYRVPVYSTANGYILERSATQNLAQNQSTSSSVGGASGGGMGSMSGGGGSSMGSSNQATPQGSNSTMPTENSPVLTREGQYVSAGQSIFTIYNNTSLVVEFAFNPALAAQIKRGQKLVFRLTADPKTVYTGTIGLIQPTFRAGGNFTLARVYLNDSRFAVGQLVTANIPTVSRGWWVPKNAVVQLGNTAVVFKKEGDAFTPKTVQTGISQEGHVQIIDNIGGWEIAQNAAYMVDSESFIRTESANQTED